jgi:ferredoxin
MSADAVILQSRSEPPGGVQRATRVYARHMRVEVNSELCQGHNRCYALAPELFDVDDYGNAMVVGDGSVAADLEDKARLAAANCPEYAITVIEG